MTRIVYTWECEFGEDQNIISNWFIDGAYCEKCSFPLQHSYKYCPQCGELIEGIKNPKPKIKR